MKPRSLNLSPKTVKELTRLKREAETDKAVRVATRIHAVLLNHQGHFSGEIARRLCAPRSKVSHWLRLYEALGWKGLLEGHRTGRPPELNSARLTRLARILRNGPSAYGFKAYAWTSLLIAQVIREEFDVTYHPGHVRRLLAQIGGYGLRIGRGGAPANGKPKSRWRRYGKAARAGAVGRASTRRRARLD